MLKERALRLSVGEHAYVNGEACRIVAVPDLERVIVELVRDQRRLAISVTELRKLPQQSPDDRQSPELEHISPLAWSIAEKRMNAIAPLLISETRTKAQVTERATEVGTTYTTLYRWMSRYESSGRLSSLLPLVRGGGRGKSRLSREQETLVIGIIESHYLNKQKLTPQNVHRELCLRAYEAGIKAPSVQTIRNRIGKIDSSLVAKRRHGNKAERKFLPTIGSFPKQEGPYKVVQIDHTMIDVQLVDEHYRRPIGRAYLTIAIDVFSRMVAGFYISLDPSGDLSTGLCLVHAILPKKPWLDRLGLDAPWPCHGLMDVIHTDNAKEFRGKTLARAAAEYGITLNRRPVRQPQYGGHIERLIGTTLKQLVHTLPGSTFSNVTQKGEYDSDGNARLTIAETERILALWFTGSYHQTVHRGIQMTPMEKYRLGRLANSGDERSTARLPDDPERLRLDFMPTIERCILPYGVVIDDVYYWSDILRTWINAADPLDKKKKRLFLFKRDPRDVSIIQFLDPKSNTFHPIPYRQLTRPSISLWELRAAKKLLRDRGKEAVDEHAIFQAHRAIQEEVRSAAERTRSARREFARGIINRKIKLVRDSVEPAIKDVATLTSAEVKSEDIPEFEVHDR